MGVPDLQFPKEGVFGLSAYEEACRLYGDFFEEQTPIKAFRLSITLYHLLEWVVPGGNSKKQQLHVALDENGPDRWKSELLKELRALPHYEVLRSLADNAKHHTLHSPSYEKAVDFGFYAGRSVAGERLGQVNLVVLFEGQEVWLREVFAQVLAQYQSTSIALGFTRQ